MVNRKLSRWNGSRDTGFQPVPTALIKKKCADGDNSMHDGSRHGLKTRDTGWRFIAILVIAGISGWARAADVPKEDDYYKIIKLPIPTDAVIEPGGLEWMPDGKLAVS